MSKSNNVNPDHYKVAGRERPGHVLVKGPKEPQPAAEKTRERWERRAKKGSRPKA